MIDKIIHYCWFGRKEKPDEVKNNIRNWSKILPDYNIIEWNEDTIHYEQLSEYAKNAFNLKEWAFLSDYVRLRVLYEYGGIYMDTDVEVIKKFDDLLMYNKVFIGFESRFSVCSAVIGAEKNSNFIKKLLNLYQKNFFVEKISINKTPNSKLFFEYIEKNYGSINFLKITRYEDFTLFPAEYFSPINCYTLKTNISKNTYTIHYFLSSWKNKKSIYKDKILALITRIIGEENREKIRKILKK
ncbi:glycosyltransferase family 32 protein [Liquorilactobacillus mali]|uniref:glycosyltransferase family 32 protein n=1 Tax=Liquorilactobacillus mali TaxID=1618 RepID=UPI002955422B|nr:glycosyltransferase [Liquorilactobacillus mali]MDV7757569.1 hypothetical protein [Liquorilactobacillus mali]